MRQEALPFPDLKGQAPLRHGRRGDARGGGLGLFLTSKVRLHCDLVLPFAMANCAIPFPDLKGQAPLRLHVHIRDGAVLHPFPDLKGQAPLRPGGSRRRCMRRRGPFPDLKGQAPLRQIKNNTRFAATQPFPDLKGQAPLRR